MHIIIDELGFTATAHEPCLYYKRDEDDNLTLILRQVDDFLVANKDSTECDRIGKQRQDRMTNPLNQLGTIRKFTTTLFYADRYHIHTVSIASTPHHAHQPHLRMIERQRQQLQFT